MALRLTEFATREDASRTATLQVARALAADVLLRGEAVLMVSGGATPLRMFELLAETEIEWARVTIGLVDERWVPPDDPESNERLVRAHLLTGRAAAAGFAGMKTRHDTPEEAQADRSLAYAPLCSSPSMVVLGMGPDGHTASWFPGAPGLADLVSAANDHVVSAVYAAAATIPKRLTLTGPAVFAAREAILLVFGEDKRDLLLASDKIDPLNCPVRFAIDGLGERLAILWAP